MTAAAALATTKPVLALQDIRKTFGGVVAIENFSLEVYPGEIVALVGDNGAGKSTLIKIVSGVHAPTSGSISIEGQPVAMTSATMARAHGIEVVYQDLALADQQTVYMNMFLGREPTNALGLLDRRRMIAETEKLVKELDVRIPSAHATIRDAEWRLVAAKRVPDRVVENMRAGHRQARCAVASTSLTLELIWSSE